VEDKFPLVMARALIHMGSDHTSLLVDAGSLAHMGKSSHFSFELSWLRQEGFNDLVKEAWLLIIDGETHVEKL
jgi:hypothetical protein